MRIDRERTVKWRGKEMEMRWEGLKVSVGGYYSRLNRRLGGLRVPFYLLMWKKRGDSLLLCGKSRTFAPKTFFPARKFDMKRSRRTLIFAVLMWMVANSFEKLALYEEIVKGGTLEFQMSSKPCKKKWMKPYSLSTEP